MTESAKMDELIVFLEKECAKKDERIASLEQQVCDMCMFPTIHWKQLPLCFLLAHKNYNLERTYTVSSLSSLRGFCRWSNSKKIWQNLKKKWVKKQNQFQVFPQLPQRQRLLQTSQWPRRYCLVCFFVSCVKAKYNQSNVIATANQELLKSKSHWAN